MLDDPIVEEIRQHRQVHSALYGYDLDRIVEALQEYERYSQRPVLNPGPKIPAEKSGLKKLPKQ